MRVLVYSAHSYDRRDLDAANVFGYQLDYVDGRLSPATARLAEGYEAVCCFVNDDLGAAVLELLVTGGTRLVLLRCAGFNNVDLSAATRLELTVMRVPAYSPHAVAEHAVGLVLTLNRQFHRAYNRVRENDFRLDGLEGFDLYGKTVGVVGAGRIGAVFAGIMRGFGCRVLVCDPTGLSPALLALGVEQADFEVLLEISDILSLHCPLTPASHHLIGSTALERMRPGVMLINTSRGGLLDTAAVILALKSGRIGALGLDVYEQEGDLFFQDLSSQVVTDDVFQRLLTFPNVVITGHQAYFTREALSAIASTTLGNLEAFAAGRAAGSAHRLGLQQIFPPPGRGAQQP